jgi:VWFA-related protein
MEKLAYTLLAALILTVPLAAQSSQDLPVAPSAAQPRFPGAPAQPPQAQSAQPQATPVRDLPAPPPAAAAQDVPAQPAATQSAPTAQIPATQTTPAKPKAAPKPMDPSSAFAPVTAAPPRVQHPNQVEPETGGDAEYRIGVDVDLVAMIFTAVDKKGHYIKDLKREDVRLLDEGKPPQRIEAFESETGLPLRVGLLIDASNSIRDRFRFEQDAAVEFLNQTVRRGNDQVFVVGFDSLSDLTQDFTDDTNMLARGVRILRPGGGTALFDAVIQASDKLAHTQVKGPSRKAIILLSDGDDNQSRHTRAEAIEAALRADLIIFVISTNISDSDRKGDKVLQQFAEQTGGRVFFPLRIEEVSNSFAEIQDELRSQYVVAYKPQNFEEDGRYRPVTLDAVGRPGVKLRARKGYYAPKRK